MNFGDERTGGIDHPQTALARPIDDRGRHAMGAEYRQCATRDGIDVIDEHCAASREIVHDVLVVDDLVEHIDRRTVGGERPLGDLDRSCHTGAETARLGEQRLHPR